MDRPGRAKGGRIKAAECEQSEKDARDPEVKQGFAKMARQWRELAEQAEGKDN
jgi:hypothetical protein